MATKVTVHVNRKIGDTTMNVSIEAESYYDADYALKGILQGESVKLLSGTSDAPEAPTVVQPPLEPL
jgi:hypothetical protein